MPKLKGLRSQGSRNPFSKMFFHRRRRYHGPSGKNGPKEYPQKCCPPQTPKLWLSKSGWIDLGTTIQHARPTPQKTRLFSSLHQNANCINGIPSLRLHLHGYLHMNKSGDPVDLLNTALKDLRCRPSRSLHLSIARWSETICALLVFMLHVLLKSKSMWKPQRLWSWKHWNLDQNLHLTLLGNSSIGNPSLATSVGNKCLHLKLFRHIHQQFFARTFYLHLEPLCGTSFCDLQTLLLELLTYKCRSWKGWMVCSDHSSSWKLWNPSETNVDCDAAWNLLWSLGLNFFQIDEYIGTSWTSTAIFLLGKNTGVWSVWKQRNYRPGTEVQTPQKRSTIHACGADVPNCSLVQEWSIKSRKRTQRNSIEECWKEIQEPHLGLPVEILYHIITLPNRWDHWRIPGNLISSGEYSAELWPWAWPQTMWMLAAIVQLFHRRCWLHCNWWHLAALGFWAPPQTASKLPALVHPSHKHWWPHWWHSAELWPWAWPQTMSSNFFKTTKPTRDTNSLRLLPLFRTVFFKRRLNALGLPFHQRPIPGAPLPKRQLNPRSPA